MPRPSHYSIRLRDRATGRILEQMWHFSTKREAMQNAKHVRRNFKNNPEYAVDLLTFTCTSEKIK